MDIELDFLEILVDTLISLALFGLVNLIFRLIFGRFPLKFIKEKGDYKFTSKQTGMIFFLMVIAMCALCILAYYLVVYKIEW